MSDAFEIPLDAEFCKNGLAEIALEFLAGAVNPDATEADACGSVHEVPHHEASVVDVGAARIVGILVGDDDKDDWRTVERIEAFLPAADFAVLFHNLVAEFLVRDGDDDGGLLVLAGGREGACADDGFEFFVRNHVGLEVAAATAGFENADGFVFDSHDAKIVRICAADWTAKVKMVANGRCKR